MARFTSGDLATRNGRPVTIAGVTSDGRYNIFYTDEQGGVEFNVFGRVLSDREGCQVCGWEDYTPICPSCKMDQIQVDAVAVTPEGTRVRIIGVDSDPSCEVMAVREDNPDVVVSIAREELTVVNR